ncbi:MAG: 30S ribosomal protein S20 [Anaerolineae bacterium]|jgi:small subunit ribosomal protein S20
MITLSTQTPKGVYGLPATASAKKRLRQGEKRRLHNRVYRSRARTYIKRANRLIDQGRSEDATSVVQLAASALDRATQKGVLHKRNAARRKARLYRRLHQASSETGG